jgi:hypothetical protein
LVLIDEYDAGLVNSFRDGWTTSSDLKKIEECLIRFFVAIKIANKRQVFAFVTGVPPLRLDSFAMGFDHASHITNDFQFASMYGFVEADLRRALDKFQPSLPSNISERLMDHFKRQYNGYYFFRRQGQPLFAPARMMQFLDTVYDNWNTMSFKDDLPNGDELFDHLLYGTQNDFQTCSAGRTLQLIDASVNPSKSIVQQLLSSSDASVKLEKGILRHISVGDTSKTDVSSLLSLM